MTGWVIVALVLVNSMLLALCGVLAWLWLDQRKTTRLLATRLVLLLKTRPDEETRVRWLRAVDSGDAEHLSPRPPDPDR